jgi:hypothetical protein
MNDGRVVAIKHIVKEIYTEEIELTKKFCIQKIHEPGNPCVPVIDTFVLSWGLGRPTADFIAMPFLTRFDDPPFYTVREALDFVGQALAVRERPHLYILALMVSMTGS